MTIKGSGAITQAFNLVSTKAPKQPTKEGMAQTIGGQSSYSDGLQKVSALARVEGKTSPTYPKGGRCRFGGSARKGISLAGEFECSMKAAAQSLDICT